jgi:hypothetical protein
MGPRALRLLARRQALEAREGILTYGSWEPITVAGPRPILTAFPTSRASKFSSRLYNFGTAKSNALKKQRQHPQRFFHCGLRFSTSARKPSCESSRR